MAKHIISPSIVKAAGNKPKIIEEFIGHVNTQNADISIARMKSPGGWTEPGQKPEFREYTLVLSGELRVRTKDREYTIRSGQVMIIEGGEWVQYSTPEAGGAEYISVCLPAFSPATVHRDS